MAKWGEGDPRWLVEHREDGKNVNGWHWSEVNRLEWSKQRLAELLPGVDAAVSAADGAHSCCCRVAAVKSVTGEVSLFNRHERVQACCKAACPVHMQLNNPPLLLPMPGCAHNSQGRQAIRHVRPQDHAWLGVHPGGC